MNCAKCGRDIEEGAEICPLCGGSLVSASDNILVDIDEDAIGNREKSTELLKKPLGGDEKTFFLVAGCSLILVGIIILSTYFVLRRLLTSASDWVDEVQMIFDSTQVTEVVAPAATVPDESDHIMNDSVIYGESEVLHYGIIAEESYNHLFLRIVQLELVTMEKQVLVSEEDGVSPIFYLPEVDQSYFSSDGQIIATIEGSIGNELLLFRRGEVEAFYEDREGYKYDFRFGRGFSTLSGFSPDGKYFAYSESLGLSENYVNVVDLAQGSTFQIEGVIFGTFLPNSIQIIAYRINSEDQIVNMELLDIDDKTSRKLVDLDIHLNDIVLIPTFSSKDGNFVFYCDHDSLMSISLQNGDNKKIYSFDYVYLAIAFRPRESDKIIIVDGPFEKLSSLYIYDPKDDDLVTVDHRLSIVIFLDDLRYFSNQPAIDFSPDQKYLAYPVGNFGMMELRIAELEEGIAKTISNYGSFISFRFSPDNQNIAYVKYKDDYGDLYITDFQGRNERFLDEYVVSYQFIEGGEYVVYSKLEDTAESIPTSFVYRIGKEGEGKTLLFSETGRVVFIDMP